MAKNMTRKGLAIAGAFALGASALVATPAQAAAAITLTDLNNKGNYSMVAGELFTFSAAGNADFVGDETKLKVKVTNNDGVAASGIAISLDGQTTFTAVDAEVAGTAGGETTNGDSAGDYAARLADGTGTDTALGSTAGDTAVFALGAADDDADGSTFGVSAMTSPFRFQLTSSPSSTQKTASYKVEVFFDGDNDGVLDAGELTSSQTVTFVNTAEITPTVVIDEAVKGGSSAGATITLPGFAVDQLTPGEFGAHIRTLTAGTYTVVGLDAAAHNTAKTALVVSIGSLANTVLVAGHAVAVQFGYLNAGFDTTTAGNNTNIGSEATLVIKARTVEAVTASLVETVTTDSATDNALAGKEFSVEALLEDSTVAAEKDPVAGTSVKIKVEVLDNTTGAKTLSDTVYVTINGVKYTDAAKLPGASATYPELTAVSDANGKVSVAINTTGLDSVGAADADVDAVKVTFTVETLTAVSKTVDVYDAAYTLAFLNSNGGIYSTTAGGTVSLQVQVNDQFGGVPADEYDVRAQFNAGSSTSRGTGGTAATIASNTFAPLVGGKATLGITDNGTGAAGTSVYDISVEKRQNGGGYTGSDIDSRTSTATLQFVSAAALVPGAIDMDANADLAVDTDDKTLFEKSAATPLALEALKAWDSRTPVGTEPSPETNSDVILDGVVKTTATLTSAAVAVDGAAVTISGAGMLFKATVDNSKTVWSPDSITVYTDGSGAYSVLVYSNKVGEQTVTVTAGSAVSTAKFTYSGAADDTATAIVIDAPSSVLPGSTVSATASLTDKYGNPVVTNGKPGDGWVNGATDPTFSLTYTGPGLVVGTEAPTSTGKGGTAKVGRFLGSNDTGSITITATYDADGTGTAFKAITVTKTIVIGTAGNTGAYSSWTKKLDDNSAKMYAKNVVGEGKVQFFLNGEEIAWVRAVDATDPKLRTANGSAYLVRTVEFEDGKNVLEIYLDGVRTTRTAYTK